MNLSYESQFLGFFKDEFQNKFIDKLRFYRRGAEGCHLGWFSLGR